MGLSMRVLGQQLSSTTTTGSSSITGSGIPSQQWDRGQWVINNNTEYRHQQCQLVSGSTGHQRHQYQLPLTIPHNIVIFTNITNNNNNNNTVDWNESISINVNNNTINEWSTLGHRSPAIYWMGPGIEWDHQQSQYRDGQIESIQSHQIPSIPNIINDCLSSE